MSAGSRRIGSPRSPVEERFRPRRRFVRPTVPRPFRIGIILSCPLSPSEFLLRLSRSVPIRGVTRVPSHTGDRSCQDFLPHRDITSSVHDPLSRHAGFPDPASFRPQAFSASRRFAPPPASRACFIPRPRPGFVSVQGFLPTRSWQRLVTATFLRAVPTRALTGKPAATHAPVDFEASLRESMRFANQAVKPDSRPLPSSGFSPLPGTSSTTVNPENNIRSHPLMAFPTNSLPSLA
jgi:hypothetical protein